MRQVMATRLGGPEVLEVVEAKLPSAGPGELLVEVTAAGVNFLDIYRRSGIYPMPFPHVVGTEGAGVVAAVGRDVSGVAVGDRVAWVNTPGSCAEYQVIPAAAAVRVPDALQLTTAAAVALQGITAHFLTNSTYEVAAGDAMLVHAAAGGVGSLVVQLGRSKGAVVIGTVSSEEKKQRALQAGAHHVIQYGAGADVADEVKRLTDWEGVAVVYDGVGKDTFDMSLASLRRRGMLVLFGGASGQVAPVDPQRLNTAGSVYLTRPTIGDYIAERAELEWRSSEVFQAVTDGRLVVRIADSLPLEKASDAHAALEGRRTSGKLILIPALGGED